MNKFILGSGSKSRLILLQQINIKPDLIVPAYVDETPKKKEDPETYVKRMACNKCQEIIKTYNNDYILTADTIITRNRKILQKAHNNEELTDFLHFLSGKSCRVLTAVCFAKNGIIIAKKLISTKIKFKHLNENDITTYLNTNNGIGNSGGIYIEGILESMIKNINGSYSNIKGLPLYEVRNILISHGIIS